MMTAEADLPRNIFDALPEALPDEVFENLVATETVRIVRITSKGQTSPEGEWYDQSDSEWVMVLRGEARILVEDRGEHCLGPGDTLREQEKKVLCNRWDFVYS